MGKKLIDFIDITKSYNGNVVLDDFNSIHQEKWVSMQQQSNNKEINIWKNNFLSSKDICYSSSEPFLVQSGGRIITRSSPDRGVQITAGYQSDYSPDDRQQLSWSQQSNRLSSKWSMRRGHICQPRCKSTVAWWQNCLAGWPRRITGSDGHQFYHIQLHRPRIQPAMVRPAECA